MSIAGVEHKNIALLYAQELSIEDKLTLALTNDAEDVMVMSVICERLQDATICSAFSLKRGRGLMVQDSFMQGLSFQEQDSLLFAVVLE